MVFNVIVSKNLGQDNSATYQLKYKSDSMNSIIEYFKSLGYLEEKKHSYLPGCFVLNYYLTDIVIYPEIIEIHSATTHQIQS